MLFLPRHGKRAIWQAQCKKAFWQEGRSGGPTKGGQHPNQCIWVKKSQYQSDQVLQLWRKQAWGQRVLKAKEGMSWVPILGWWPQEGLLKKYHQLISASHLLRELLWPFTCHQGHGLWTNEGIFFFDLKDTQDWSNSEGKGLANWLIWVVSLHPHHTTPSCPFLSKVA